jgi:hypothetical protein
VTGEVGRQAVEIFPGLGLDAGERVPLRLGLDNSDRLASGVEHVVGEAGRQRKLAHRHAEPGGDIHPRAVLHDPASLLQLAVDLLPGCLFRSHARPALGKSIPQTVAAGVEGQQSRAGSPRRGGCQPAGYRPRVGVGLLAVPFRSLVNVPEPSGSVRLLEWSERRVSVPAPNGTVVPVVVRPLRSRSVVRVPDPKGCVRVVVPSDQCVNVPEPNIRVVPVTVRPDRSRSVVIVPAPNGRVWAEEPSDRLVSVPEPNGTVVPVRLPIGRRAGGSEAVAGWAAPAISRAAATRAVIRAIMLPAPSVNGREPPVRPVRCRSAGRGPDHWRDDAADAESCRGRRT